MHLSINTTLGTSAVTSLGSYRDDVLATAGMASGAARLARSNPAAASGAAQGAVELASRLRPASAYYGGFVAIQQAVSQLQAGIAHGTTSAGRAYQKAADLLLRAAASARQP